MLGEVGSLTDGHRKVPLKGGGNCPGGLSRWLATDAGRALFECLVSGSAVLPWRRTPCYLVTPYDKCSSSQDWRGLMLWHSTCHKPGVNHRDFTWSCMIIPYGHLPQWPRMARNRRACHWMQIWLESIYIHPIPQFPPIPSPTPFAQ